MKKILAILAVAAVMQGVVFAQKAKPVLEKDVKVNYVKDFQRQVTDATNVEWFEIDEKTFKVTYLDFEKSRQAMVFTPKGSETHYFVDKQYIPSAIKDTVSNMYAKYKIQDCWVRKMRGKMTYQASIAKVKGFLWWKKTTNLKILSFEIDGKFIKEEE